jgi:polygalacturonase
LVACAARRAEGEKLVIKSTLRRVGSSPKVWLAALAVAGLPTATAGVAVADMSTNDVAPAGTSADATAFNLKSFGAKADGKNNDAPAFDRAITAASEAGGGVVNVPAGVTVQVAGPVHLNSNVMINVPSGSTITGSASGYDEPESNPNDRYQDYGHSHFHNAMFYGDNVNNVTFTVVGRSTAVVT